MNFNKPFYSHDLSEARQDFHLFHINGGSSFVPSVLSGIKPETVKNTRVATLKLGFLVSVQATIVRLAVSDPRLH